MTRFVISSVFVLFFAVTSQVSAQTSPEAASQFIGGLSEKALSVLRADGVALNTKEAQVRELLSENFDLDLIGRFVLGKSWRSATPEQRDQYQALFREFVLRTYSRRLGGYSGQSFEIVGARPVGKKDVLVSTKISRPNAPPIEAGWRVRNGANGPKILDVVVSGVSMVVTQRSEFRSVVSKQGIDGLIEVLRAQVTKFAARGT